MKAKIKLRLTNEYSYQNIRDLIMFIELKDKPFTSSYHEYKVIDGSKLEYISNISKDKFYNDVYNFITNEEQIIKKGKEFLKDILKNKSIEQKKEEIEKLLKNFKPIEIEVK